MAVGNTFGATALSSYGGFWLSFAIILTPGGFAIEDAYTTMQNATAFLDAFGFFLMVCFHLFLGLSPSSSTLPIKASHLTVGGSNRAGSSLQPFSS